MSLGSKRPTFKPTPYGYSRRRRRGIPRWLLLLITGIVLGAGGVLFLQRSYGPERLTVEQSEQLRVDLNAANLDNQRLNAEVKRMQESVQQSQELQEQQAQQVAQLRKQYTDMESGIAELIHAIPPDPRGTSPGIRAVDMIATDDGLEYRILLIQDIPEGEIEAPELNGTIKLIAMGAYSNGHTAYLDIAENSLHMGRYTVIEGTADVPKGFRPREVTIQVTADGSDKVIATRTIRVAGRR